MKTVEENLSKIFPVVKRNEPLCKYTTARVGGNAAWLVEATEISQVADAVSICAECKLPYFILGGGSNIIFSDKGYPGVIVRNRTQTISISDTVKTARKTNQLQPRFQPLDNLAAGSSQEDETEQPQVLVRADSGLKLSVLMKKLYQQQITGLQWFAGIPGTVGGAVYMNIHGGTHFFSDIVENATILSGDGIKKVSHDYFQFDYDWSILHRTGEIVLQAELVLTKGNVARAKEQSVKWAKEKSHQPQKSAGCVFRNISEQERVRLCLPTTSTGYIIDKILGLKGTRIGGALISTHHAAFIENTGSAKAGDFYKLVQLIKQKAKERLDINLILEVEFIGEFEERHV